MTRCRAQLPAVSRSIIDKRLKDHPAGSLILAPQRSINPLDEVF